MASLYLLLLTFLVAPVLYLFLKSKRRLSLPPGPKGWPVLGCLPHLGSKPHQTLHAMSLTYGPLLHLRLGSVHVVVASSAAAASHFLRTHDANFSNRPMNSSAKYMAYNGHNIGWYPSGPRWRMLRKLCNVHLISSRALDNSRSMRQEEVVAMLSGLEECREGEVDVGRWLSACTANNLTRAMLGRRLFSEKVGGGDGEEVGEFREMITELVLLGGAFVVGDFVPALQWLDLGGYVGRMKRVAKRYDAFLDQVIEEHPRGCGALGKHKDMLSTMLEENVDDEGGKLTREEIKAVLFDLFIGGTDTASDTVEWALSELIRHPDVLHKAHQELDSVVGRERLVQESDLSNLPFIQAIVKETFRLHPPTPLLLPRMAAESCEVDGYYIPKHAALFINMWAIGRDPKSWTEPLKFRPERFLPGGESAHVDVKGNDFELIPFGAGRRICVGMGLGWCMVQLMTASLLHAFDWALPPGQAPENLSMEEVFGMTLQRAVPLTACPRPRLAPHVYQN